MAYTPPAGDAVDFNATGAAYTPPAGDQVNFPNDDRLVIECGSVASFVGATPISNGVLSSAAQSSLAWQASATTYGNTESWNNAWTVSGTTLDWRSSFEKQRDFTSTPKTTVLWNARFEAGADVSLAPATSISWKSATIVNVPVGCSCPPYCPTPRYATQGRFTSQCKTRVCIKWCSC